MQQSCSGNNLNFFQISSTYTEIIRHLFIFQAPIVQKVDNAIHWINNYPGDRIVYFVNTYPLDSNLSSR